MGHLAATGRAVHSSRPDAGENAILKLTRALDEIDRAMAKRLPAYADPALGAPTCNVGVIRGGARANIVPDLAEAELDIRTTPALAATPGGAGGFLRAVIEECALPVEMTNPCDNPPMETPSDHPDVRKLLAARPGTHLTGAPWFSDAAHLAAAGLPAVCLGPGSIDQAHTAGEFIDLTALDEGARQFSAYLASLR
jgi:acetylornithine deacetylase/succinyl-diaminopimelate desuccinylase-like protein